MYIQDNKAIGHTWLFYNDRSEGKPLPEKLAEILLGKQEIIPKFFAEKMGDCFECSDGNHRIYGAFLLNRPIKIRCYAEMTEIKLTRKPRGF